MKKVELLAVLGLVCVGSFAVAVEGGDSVSVGEFLDSMGVCTHIGQGIDEPVKSAEAMAYAGIRHIRDDGSPSHVQDWIAVH